MTADEFHEKLLAVTEERNAALTALAEQATRNQALKGQITRLERAGIPNEKVQAVFTYWHSGFGKNKNTKLGPKRAKMIRGALALTEQELEPIKRAIDGLKAKPNVGPRGRARQPYPGSRVLDDLRYAIRDEEQMEDAQRWLEEAKLEEMQDAIRASDRDTKRMLKDPVGSLREDQIAQRGRNHEDRTMPRWNSGHLELVLGKLAQADCTVKANGPGRFMAQCPHHEDRSPSLSIRECDDGTVLLNCFAGCGTYDVIQALGLEWRDIGRPFRETDFDALKAAFPERYGSAA